MRVVGVVRHGTAVSPQPLPPLLRPLRSIATRIAACSRVARTSELPWAGLEKQKRRQRERRQTQRRNRQSRATEGRDSRGRERREADDSVAAGAGEYDPRTLLRSAPPTTSHRTQRRLFVWRYGALWTAATDNRYRHATAGGQQCSHQTRACWQHPLSRTQSQSAGGQRHALCRTVRAAFPRHLLPRVSADGAATEAVDLST